MVAHAITPKPYRETTQLFSIRLWYVTDEHGHGVLRGRAQHVLSGETYDFEEWSALCSFLGEQLVQQGLFPDGALRSVDVRPQ